MMNSIFFSLKFMVDWDTSCIQFCFCYLIEKAKENFDSSIACDYFRIITDCVRIYEQVVFRDKKKYFVYNICWYDYHVHVFCWKCDWQKMCVKKSVQISWTIARYSPLVSFKKRRGNPREEIVGATLIYW